MVKRLAGRSITITALLVLAAMLSVIDVASRALGGLLSKARGWTPGWLREFAGGCAATVAAFLAGLVALTSIFSPAFIGRWEFVKVARTLGLGWIDSVALGGRPAIAGGSQPTARDLHVDAPLTMMSIGYRNAAYIADQICPMVPVTRQSNIVPKYDQSHWFRDTAQLRAPGTRSRGGGYTVDTTDKYFADRYSYRFEIPDDVRDNADAPYADLDRDGTYFITDKLQMRREIAFANAFFTTGVWGADKVGGTDFTQWSDYGGSQPLIDMAVFLDDVESRIGMQPNTAVIGKQVWLQAKWHPDLLDTIKYTQRGQISPEIAASLFEVEKFLIGRSIYTTTAEGTAEASVSYTRIWGKNVLLLWVPAAPSLIQPAACYTFVWRRVADALQYIKRMRDEEREVDILESNSYFNQKQTAKAAGEFLSAAVA